MATTTVCDECGERFKPYSGVQIVKGRKGVYVELHPEKRHVNRPLDICKKCLFGSAHVDSDK